MEPELPYWKTLPNVAPIKAEFILWEKVNSRTTTAAVDLDDAAEGRSSDKPTVSRNEEDRLAKLENSNIASTSTLASTSVTSDHPPPSPETGERNSKKPRLDSSVEAGIEIAEVTVVQPEKKVRLSGGQKKKLKRAEQDRIWNEKRAEKEKIKAEGGTVKKEKGQNKGRKFEKRAGEQEIKLCSSIAKGKVCARVDSGCRWDHDLISYLAGRPLDVPIVLPISDNDLSTTISTTRMCPSFETLGECSQGFKCRFGLSHMKQVTAGEGFAGSDWILIINEEKVAKVAADKGEGLSEIRERGEMNVISIDRIKIVRGQGIDKDQRFPLSVAYLNSIGEPIDLREGKDGKKKKDPVKKSTVYVVNESDDDQELPAPPIAPTSSLPPPPVEIDIDSQPSRNFIPDMAPIRAGEKKTLDFRNKLYLAPLTTVGNLPFRRLCGDFGNDISCSEMGLSQEFLNGNASEWSLVRRHPSEKVFGVQICGSRPQALVPAAEAIVKSCDIDFLDVNCGCPIDLVFNKGAGSALLQHATRLGKSLVGMSQVLGEIPLTIKIRTGVNNSSPVAHKLVTRMQTEWGISAVTLHGRSRQQRYKTKADYAYIAQCAKTLREAAEDQGLKPIPIFGNGDAYDYRTYYENMESSGVDGIMIARGALVKPWIFTEIKEKRDWDISSRERLDMLGQLVNYGMDHWGSDQIGLNTTRRFFCEALSFQHRYIPVGLLEHLPAQLNDRPYPYKGRNELESLLASDQSSDWVKISEMFLGPAPEDWNFAPKHKSNANGTTDDVKISAEG